MITVIFFILTLIILRKNLFKAKITSIFLLSFLIKVIFPFYHYSKNSEIHYYADILCAISLFIVIFFSIRFEKNVRPLRYQNILSRNYIYISFLFFPVVWFFFLIPALIDGGQIPLFLALNGDYINAHDLRVYITKSSNFGFLVDLIGKVLFPMLLLIIALTYKYQKSYEKFLTYIFLFITIIISFAYFQKAFPFILLLVFFIGLSISGYMSFLKWSKFFILCFFLLLLVSNLYGSDFISGLLKFQDLLFRRLGKTPVLVYIAYIDFGNEYGLKLLENSFILNKSPQNPALPMLIYQFLSYGDSDTGWANGLYVGDLYVNFGLFGVIIFSILIGLIIKMGNLFIKYSKFNFFYIIGTMSITMFCLNLPGNSFFSFSTFFYLILFFTCFCIVRNIKYINNFILTK